LGRTRPEGLQNAANAILQRRNLRHDLGARHQQRTFGLAVEALHRHLTVPADTHDLRQAKGVVGIGLVALSDSAALAWRVSTQITGSPASFNSWNSQLDSCPLSSPIRTAWGACCFTADAMASGVESTWPRDTIL
jgi:hypothetical protein